MTANEQEKQANKSIKYLAILVLVLLEMWGAYTISYVDGPFTRTDGFLCCVIFTISVSVAIPCIDGVFVKSAAFRMSVALVMLLAFAWTGYTLAYSVGGIFALTNFQSILGFGGIIFGLAVFASIFDDSWDRSWKRKVDWYLMGEEKFRKFYEGKMKSFVRSARIKGTIVITLVWLETMGFYLAIHYDGPYCKSGGFIVCAIATVFLTLFFGLYLNSSTYEETVRSFHRKLKRKLEEESHFSDMPEPFEGVPMPFEGYWRDCE